MSRILFRKLPKNSRLTAVGNFSNENNVESFWRLSTHFKLFNNQNWNKKFEIEMACIMGVGRTFVQKTSRPYESMNFTRNYYLPDISTWETKRLGECPRLSNELRNIGDVASQLCFVLKCGKTTIWLPKFELARKLFFHSGFMVRAAFSPNGLESLFNLQINENCAVINTFEKYGVPARYFRHEEYRHFFAWLLLTPEAKSSFESIWKCITQEQYLLSEYWQWQFNFIPPEFLSGLKVTLRGPYDSEFDEMLVWEIAALHSLPCKVNYNVEFRHPSIKQPIKGTGNGAGDKNKSTEGDNYIDDEEPANEEKETNLIELPSEGLSFSKKVSTKLTYHGKVPRNYGRKDDNESSNNQADTNSSTKDPEIGGESQPVDFDKLNEKENPATYESHFKHLVWLLQELDKTEEVKYIGKQIQPTPAIKGCRFHKLTSEKNRCYLFAKFQLPDKSYRYIFEIDTSDRSRSLSTKIIQFKDESSKEVVIENILKKSVKNSLRWPQSYIQSNCIQVHDISHPKLNNGAYSENAIDNWRIRLLKALTS